MNSYFGKENTGGSYASKGFRYQDYCSLIYLFKYIDNDKFLELAAESTNDFIMIFKDKEISVQVKKRHLTLKEVRSLMENINQEEDTEYVFIATSFDKSLRDLILKAKWFKNIQDSSSSDKRKLKVKNEFIQELKKYDYEHLYDKLIITKFDVIPEEFSNIYLSETYHEMLDRTDIFVNRRDLLNALKLEIVEIRCDRKFINKEKLKDIINQYKKEPEINKIVKKVYENHISNPSETLKALGETNKSILDDLEKKIVEADELARNNNYREALRIYSSLATIYERDNILVNCAALCELEKEYGRAIEYGNLAIKKNEYNYDAHFILGTSYCKTNIENKFDLTLHHFKKANDIKETGELYHNIGYTYYLKGDRCGALKNYEKALELDNNLANTHLNISDLVPYEKSLYHLNQAIKLDKDMYQAYSKKGELLRFIGLPNMALKYFKKCLTYDKFNQESLKGMALSLFELGRFDESMIYLSDWIRECKNDLFKSFEKDRESLIICIDWFKTTFFKLKVLDKNHILINMPDGVRCIDISEKDGNIFIGAIKYDVKKLGFPIAGKIFNSVKKYNEVKEQIYKNKKLWNKKINNLFDLDNFIKVNIKKFSENTYIEICSEDYKVIGYTDNNGDGTESFFNGFREFECMSIIFKCEENGELFGIDNVRNLNIEEVNDLRLDNFTEDISKEEFIKQMNL